MMYSRVGVMPEPAFSKDVKGSNKNRNTRSKGITMEDLKKQTALRLAKEQQIPFAEQQGIVRQNERHDGQLYARNYNNGYDFPSSEPSLPYPHQSQHEHQQYTNNLQTTFVQNGVAISNVIFNVGQQPIPSRERQQHHHQYQEQSKGYYGVSNDIDQSHYLGQQDQNRIPSGSSGGSYMVESHHLSNYQRMSEPQMMPRAMKPLQPTPELCLPPNTLHPRQSHIPFSSDGAQRSMMHRGNSNLSKNKLPHGLTVYELKEMTKARLQSEAAAEKSNEISEVHAMYRDPRVSPLDFDGTDSLRERTFSRDSSPPSLISKHNVGAYIQSQHAAPKMIPAKLHPQSQVLQGGLSQPPPAFLGGGAGAAPPSSLRDTWESTSVGSYNSAIYSENMGSESTSEVGSFSHSSQRNRAFTYPASQVAQQLEASNQSSRRPSRDSRLMLNPSPIQASPHRGSGVIGGTSPFNAAVGGNRRRAVTLSPNTGSILEDRPLHDLLEHGDRLEIPNFSSGKSSAFGLSASSPTRNRQREYSPVLEQLGLDASYMSNGTESSSAFRSVATNNGSSLPGIVQMGSREHDGLTPFPSHTKSKSNISTGPDEIRLPPPPPGFVTSSTSPGRQTAFSRVQSMDNSYMKNSWEPVDDNRNRSHLISEERLVNDFGSVLDLSGSRVDRERASTYTFGSKESENVTSKLYGSQF